MPEKSNPSGPPDFQRALRQIPASVVRKHHGRDPKHGLDCVGFVMAMYELAGIDISVCDMPYGQLDYAGMKPGDGCSLRRRRESGMLMTARLMMRFKQINARGPLDVRSGDVLLMGTTGFENHLGVVVGSLAWSMTSKLKSTTVVAAWPWVSRVYRHVGAR